MDHYNFSQIIYNSAERVPNKTAIITNERTLTYLELKNSVSQAGNLFLSLGVQPGDRVSILFPNDYRFLEICFGLMAIGAIPVPMNAKLGPEALSYISSNSGSKILVYHASFEKKAQSIHEQHQLEKYVVAGRNIGNSIAQYFYDDEVEKQSTTVSIYEASADDICYLPYTSGSTGNPKGCQLTHSGQFWNVQSTAEFRSLSPDDRILIPVPLYHKNGMAAMKNILYLGGSAVVLPKVDTGAILQAIHVHRCTFMTAVPAMYRSIVNHLRENSSYNLSSLRFVLCGSSDVPSELLKEINTRMGAEVYEGYGLTEGGPIVLSSKEGKSRLGSAGVPVPGCRIKIVDNGKKPVAVGEIGELWVKNPGIAVGYWNLPDVTAEKITKDGWLKTGDSAWQDEDGFVYIVGRQDDMINIAGENAYPKEIENILLRHSSIEDVCVIPIHDSIKGQVPVAFVVSRKSINEEDVKTFFIDNGPAYAHPRHVFFLDKLPLTGPGKVNRIELVKRTKKLLTERKSENESSVNR